MTDKNNCAFLQFSIVQVQRVATIVEKMCGKPFTQMASLSLVHDASPSLITGSAGVINLDSLHSIVNPNLNVLDQVDVAGQAGSPRGIDKSYAKEISVASMNELIKFKNFRCSNLFMLFKHSQFQIF